MIWALPPAKWRYVFSRTARTSPRWLLNTLQLHQKYNPVLCESLGIEVPDGYVAIGEEAEAEEDAAAEDTEEAAADETEAEDTGRRNN